MVDRADPVVVYVNHSGVSQFIDSNHTSWLFQHRPYESTALRFTSNSPGCTNTTVSPCQSPQCGSTFNLYAKSVLSCFCRGEMLVCDNYSLCGALFSEQVTVRLVDVFLQP